ncbi:MAG TPA: ribosomal RNA small subunit methyltransferase A [Clostridiales bacterium]|nr:ribosomal RNA small subunit methyltransferase A [Clostridiales bacterium]
MNRQETLAILEQHGIRPIRSLGQNFLTDDRVVERICQCAALAQNDLILEIGPGIGGLTRAMARQAGQVVAIEIDRHIIPALRDVLADQHNCTILHKDALETDLTALAADWTGQVKVVANLPYYITTPLITKALVELPQCTQLVLMIQKEAASRVMATPGSKQYGPMAVLAACFGKAHRELVVSPGSFYPQPGVDSCVISLTREHKAQLDQWPAFQQFLEACFTQRRKMLTNSLRAAGYSADRLTRLPAILAELGLPDGIRAEMITAEQFVAIYQVTSNK